MKSNIFSLLILSTLLLFSCSNDDDNKVPQPLQNDCEGTGLNKSIQCCIEGPIQAKQDQIITFTYANDFDATVYEWEVLGNSMTIVEGLNTATVKVRTSKNFVRDTLRAFGSSMNGSGCGVGVVIELY